MSAERVLHVLPVYCDGRPNGSRCPPRHRHRCCAESGLRGRVLTAPRKEPTMSTTSESYLVGLIGDGITRSLTPPMHET